MAKFEKYTHTRPVLAREVTDEVGENIVTSLGVQHVPHGDFILSDDTGLTAMDRESFDAYVGRPAKAKAKTLPPEKTAPADKPKQTAAERVKARAAAKAAK